MKWTKRKPAQCQASKKSSEQGNDEAWVPGWLVGSHWGSGQCSDKLVSAQLAQDNEPQHCLHRVLLHPQSSHKDADHSR